MMKSVCQPEKCTGCRACESKCPKNAIRFVDALDSVYAEINESLCIHCALCEKTCPNLTPVQKTDPVEWYQGWANDTDLRASSSSGGIAAAFTQSFIKQGGYVCSCVFDHGKFSFHLTNNLEDAKKFAGSKYVKSDPSAAYKSIEELLTNGEKVLFIGLPCQVAAVKNYVPEQKQDSLYCVDLICHGTPSLELLKLFVTQHGVDLKAVKDLRFRTKGRTGLNVKSFAADGTCDRYMLSFLNHLSLTDGCYDCRYASTPRVADITLGDSWGTELTDELPKGLSVVLCMTEKGRKLLDLADIRLASVNIEKAIAAQGQLVHPPVRPVRRDEFFAAIKDGANCDKMVFKILPKQCVRQLIKGVLIKLKLYPPPQVMYSLQFRVLYDEPSP